MKNLRVGFRRLYKTHICSEDRNDQFSTKVKLHAFSNILIANCFERRKYWALSSKCNEALQPENWQVESVALVYGLCTQ